MQRYFLIVAAVACAIIIAPNAHAQKQLVVVNTGIYDMKDNGHKEAHHFFEFQERPPNNDFTPYDPKGKGKWYLRMHIIERPSTKAMAIQPTLEDGKSWGHRYMVKWKVTDFPKVFTHEKTGYTEWANATPINWKNPPNAVRFHLATQDPTATTGKCGYDGQCWNFTYNRPDADQIWPYKIWMTITLVAPGQEYDDTGHPGSDNATDVELKRAMQVRHRPASYAKLFDLNGRYCGTLPPATSKAAVSRTLYDRANAAPAFRLIASESGVQKDLSIIR